MQNVLKHVGTIQREVARLGISDTEFIRWRWATPPNLTVLLLSFHNKLERKRYNSRQKL